MVTIVTFCPWAVVGHYLAPGHMASGRSHRPITILSHLSSPWQQINATWCHLKPLTGWHSYSSMREKNMHVDIVGGMDGDI